MVLRVTSIIVKKIRCNLSTKNFFPLKGAIFTVLCLTNQPGEKKFEPLTDRRTLRRITFEAVQEQKIRQKILIKLFVWGEQHLIETVSPQTSFL